jgi:hypothetical protein
MLQLVSILFVAVTFTAAIFRPSIALALLVSMFPLEQLLQANVPFFVANSSLFNIMCGVMALLATAVHWLRRPDTLIGAVNGVSLTTYGLFLYAAMSVLWTRNAAWAAETVRDGAPYAVVLLIFAPLLVNGIDDLRGFARATLVISLLISLQLLANPNLELYTARLVLEIDAAQKSNPLVIGTMGGIMMILAALLQFEKSWKWSLIRYASAFIGFGIALLSGSRGQVAFALVAAILFFPVSRRLADPRRFIGAAGAGMVLLGAVYLGMRVFISADNDVRWSSDSLYYGGWGRVENAIDLLAAWIKEPVYFLTGLGYFSFSSIPNRSGDGYSHVMIADALGELGIIGLTLYVLFYVLAIRAIVRVFRNYQDFPELRGTIAALAALFAFNFLLQNKQGTLFGIDGSWTMAMIFARIDSRDRAFGVPPEYAPDELPEFTDEPEYEALDAPLPPRMVA